MLSYFSVHLLLSPIREPIYKNYIDYKVVRIAHSPYHPEGEVLFTIEGEGVTDVDQITQIVMKWADRCAGLYRLEPSRRVYKKRSYVKSL